MNDTHAKRLARRAVVLSTGLACSGGAVFFIGMLNWRARTMVAYLAAYTFVVSLASSALFLLMMFYAMSASWPVAVRRIVETLSALFPLLVILFVPIALDLDVLYPWFAPNQTQDPHAHDILLKKLPYLNTAFWLVRSGVYLALWLGLAETLRFWSIQQDGDIAYPVWPRARKLSAAGLAIVGITTSFAAWDWIVSTSALWKSAVFGLYFLASGGVAAVAMTTAVARVLARAGKLSLNDSHYYALGRTMFGTTAFFTYIGWFQFFLIWEANVPDEVSWFVVRSQFGWTWASVAILIFGNSLLPLLALLPYRAKRSGDWLLMVSVWLVVFQYFNFWWCIGPRAHATFYWGWVEASMLALVGGLAFTFGAWRMQGCDVAPRLDPRFPKAMEYHSV